MAKHDVETSNLSCQILHTIYIEGKDACRRAARQRGISVEQLAAAAVTEALAERLSPRRKAAKP